MPESRAEESSFDAVGQPQDVVSKTTALSFNAPLPEGQFR